MTPVPDRPAPWLPTLLNDLTDLVLPGGCAGCTGAAGQPLRRGVCRSCVAALAELIPHPTRPDPAPYGLPPCAALGDYGGVLRELVLAYKDRGRHRLALPLGRLLALVVESLAAGPAVLVPIPDTPAAARARHGDHLWRLARPAVAHLRAAGYPVHLARPLRARPRADSAGLDTGARAAQAVNAFRLRPLRGAGLRRWRRRTAAPVILLDDVVTTGATLAAATATLAGAGIPVHGAAVLAATRRTRPADPGG
jgi:predicted amidophosphoribosyltransferase